MPENGFGNDPERAGLSGKVKKWEVFPGRNKFLCDGRLMLSTQTGIFYFTLFLIISTSICFFANDAAYSWEKMSPIVPILAGLQFIFVVVVLCRTACGDPGIIPRASPAEAAALERRIAEQNNEAKDAGKSSQPYNIPPRIREVTINGVNFKLKYCYTCKIFRPPRASHCSVCDNCVDRFDHHCPWVGNCVGRRNYKYFYMFLSSLTIYCAYLMAVSVAAIVLRSKEFTFAEAMSKGPLSPVVALIAFFSIWSVAGLAGFHTYLTGLNVTTNEDIKGTFKRTPGGKNPFSAGSCSKNCASILCGPLPPSLLDRRGWVTHHDIPTSSSSATVDQGRTNGRGSANFPNYNDVPNQANASTNALPGDSYGQPERSTLTSNNQTVNGRVSAPKYLPPINEGQSQDPQAREFLT